MAKSVTIKVKLVSSADTGFYYVTRKNSRTMTDKLKKKKYDPIAKKHVEFTEYKIKQDRVCCGQTGACGRPFYLERQSFGKRWPAGNGVLRRPLVTAPGPAEPHGPRRCGGPEHPVGLSRRSKVFRSLSARGDRFAFGRCVA